jgi:hypothetical protein
VWERRRKLRQKAAVFCRPSHGSAVTVGQGTSGFKGSRSPSTCIAGFLPGGRLLACAVCSQTLIALSYVDSLSREADCRLGSIATTIGKRLSFYSQLEWISANLYIQVGGVVAAG